MERRQGTLDQVFRVRKRKLVNPVTPASSKSTKFTYDQAFEDEVDSPPKVKGNLEAFLFAAKHGNPVSSTDRLGGPLTFEPGVPELRRGEVEFSSRKEWLTPCSLISRPASAEGIRKDSEVGGPDLGSGEGTSRTSTHSPIKTQIVQPQESPSKTQLVNFDTVSPAVNDRVALFQSSSAEEGRSGRESRGESKFHGGDLSQRSQSANGFYFRRKQWLTPCSLTSHPASAEATRKDSEVKGPVFGSGEGAPTTSPQSPAKTQIVQPLESPLKSQPVNFDAASPAVNDRVALFQSASAKEARSARESRGENKSHGGNSSQLSQFANEFLSLCFSGITPSTGGKPIGSEPLKVQQKRKEETTGDHADRKKACPEQQLSTQNRNAPQNGHVCTERTQRNDTLLEAERSKTLHLNLQTKMGKSQSQLDHPRPSDIDKEIAPSESQIQTKTQNHKCFEAPLPLSGSPRLSRSRDWTSNYAAGSPCPATQQHLASPNKENYQPIPRLKVEALETSNNVQVARQERTPPESNCNQTISTLLAERGGDPHVTVHSDTSTPAGKGISKHSSNQEGGEGTPFTPNPNGEGKPGPSHDPNICDSYYRSSLFSPGDEFWEEAIEIAMATKVDISSFYTGTEKSHRSSSPRKSAGGVLLRPPSNKVKYPEHVNRANYAVKSHSTSVNNSGCSPSSHQAESKLATTPDVNPSGLSKSGPSSRGNRQNATESPNPVGRLVDSLPPKSIRDGAAREGGWTKHLGHGPTSPLRVRRFDFSGAEEEQVDGRRHQEDRLDKTRDSTDAVLSEAVQRREAHLTDNALKSGPQAGLVDPSQSLGSVPVPVPKLSTQPNQNAVKAPGGEVGTTAEAVAARNETNALVGLSNQDITSALSEVVNSVSPMNNMEISDWVPQEVCSVYAEKGLKRLYRWQVECLQLKGVLEGKNLVFGASTSAGKSLVAELLMIRRIISTGRMALLVLPYVSLCSEKAAHLEALLEPLGKRVRNFFGAHGSASIPKDTSVAVCTIEKANSLINKLLEESRLSEVGVIVIDELHMVGDRDRGYLLELLLTKVRYACGELDNIRGMSQEKALANAFSQSDGNDEPKADLQIIGMSATMPNIGDVAHWLQAACYETDFRPVPLQEFIKIGNCIYNRSMEISRMIRKGADFGGKDPDHVIELCHEVVKGGHSVLVFCASRKACETSALHIAKYLPSLVAGETLRKSPAKADDNALSLEELRKSTSGLDPILEQTLPFGVAYHHAGLTVEEREVVERCFKQGLVRVLTATSTLAAGVNLPARRVIFRQPRIGRDFLDGTRYRQMSGRAGRAGIDTKGESIAICKPEEVKKMIAVLSEGCEPLQSCLTEDKIGMMRALLEVVAGGIVQTPQDVNRYVRCTLFNSTQTFNHVVKTVQESLRWLCRKKFVEWNTETQVYSTTPLGRAAFGSSLTPEESLVVFEDLAKAREGFVLASDLHLVYQVTPIYVELDPDWSLFYQKFAELSELEQAVGSRVGVLEPFLMRMAHGAPMGSGIRSKGQRTPLQRNASPGLGHGTVEGKFTGRHHTVDALRVCRRFYVALMLSKLVQEVPLMEVSNSFKVPRGTVQALQASAGRFAAMVSGFCERLGWQDLEGLVSKFQSRVSFGVRSEIVELTEIPFVKGARARALYKAGFRTIQAVAEATFPELLKALSDASPWTAQDDSRGKTQHYAVLGVARKIKAGAQRIVLDRAEEARIAAFSAIRALGVEISSSLWPSIQSSIPAASATQGKIAHEQLSGITPTPVLSQVGPGDRGIGNTPVAHLQLLQKETEKKLAAASQADGAALPMITFRKVDEQGSGHDQHKENHVSNGRVEGMSSDNGKQSQAKAESVIQKYKRVAGSSLNCFLGGMDFLNERSLDVVDTRKNAETTERANSGPIDVDKMTGEFDAFFQLWTSVDEFCFDLDFKFQTTEEPSQLFEILGIAICWQDSPVYYLNLSDSATKQRGGNETYVNGNSATIGADCHYQAAHPADDKELELLNKLKLRWKRISSMLSKPGSRKVGWSLKNQLRSLEHPGMSLSGRNPDDERKAAEVLTKVAKDLHSLDPTFLGEPYIDVRISAWLLWPDEESSQNYTLEQEVNKRLPGEVAASASRAGRWKNQTSHNRCCRRVAQVRALHSALWKLLTSEGLHLPLLGIEMPMVRVLSRMESFGVGVDLNVCCRIRQVIEDRMKVLEASAHKLAGMTFALGVPSDVARILYDHLKLPAPPGSKKGKHHPSTDKHALDYLRGQHEIAGVIKEHRKLSKLLHGTLSSIVMWAKFPSVFGSTGRKEQQNHVHKIFGRWLQTSTATGRLSMEEPNLQCVENTISLGSEVGSRQDSERPFDEKVEINTRQVFVPTQEGWTILSADYSQIEVRLLAHFSEDSALIELLSRPSGDLFRVITSQWTGVSEDSVTEQEREQTKRLVYGILYGMGVKALSEQMECSIAKAHLQLEQFKSAFPGVHSWLQQASLNCKKTGYVVTLGGRKRFLDKINGGTNAEQAKAERQAVNSICQGSAADLIKMAMIKLHDAMMGDVHDGTQPAIKGHCRLLLQIHDELLLEVDKSYLQEVSDTLRVCMEGAAPLKVPLRVKLQVGESWGTLKPFG